MVARTRALAAEHGVESRARVRVGGPAAEPRFDAVFCVGNSLAHAADRSRALCRDGGRAASRGGRSSSPRATGSANGSRLAARGRRPARQRDGRRALVTRAWIIPDDWHDPHTVDVGVSFVDADPVQTVAERLTVWPFTPSDLATDLRAVGLEVEQTTFTPQSSATW